MLFRSAIILIDDIRINEGMLKAWNEWEGDKYEATDPLHYTGYGVITV